VAWVASGGLSDPLKVYAYAKQYRRGIFGVGLLGPERNRYAYRLDGFDSAWIDTEASHRVAAYTNFRRALHAPLRGSNRDGVWSETVLVPRICCVVSDASSRCLWPDRSRGGAGAGRNCVDPG